MNTTTQTYKTEHEHMSGQKMKACLFVNPVSITQANKLLEVLIDGKLIYSKIKYAYPNIKPVEEGDPLFSFTYDDDELSRKETEGEGKPDEYKTAQIRFKPNEFKNISQSGNDYVAGTDGVFIVIDSIPKILPFNYDGSFDVKIIDSAMKVSVDLFAHLKDGKASQYEDIIKKILSLKIKVKIDEELIKEKLSELENKKESLFDIVVGVGKIPANGKDGWIECIIDTTIDNKPQVDEKGKIDYHNINSVKSVKKDTNIAVVHQPTPKVDGYNVYGSSISAKEGKKIHIGAGSNAYISEKDENLVYSKIDGFISIKDNIITVNDLHVVKGDIDFKTGNIVSNGSLKVLGDVKNGFQVKLSKNVDIGGTVVDAIVEAGEVVDIRGGFIGTEKGIVKSGGDAKIKFIQNQKVYSRGSLLFFKEIVHSEIYVKDKIIGQGLDAAIIGGYTIAGEGIEVATIGNDYGTPTKVEIGYDYNTKIHINEILAKIEEMKEEIEHVNGKIVEYSSMKRLNDTLVADLKVKAARFKELTEETKKLKEKISELNKNVYKPSGAVINVKKTVYPGVKIVINGRQYVVNEPMKSKTFSLSDDLEVVVS